MAVSGIANMDLSLATRNRPWTDTPAPPPITMPGAGRDVGEGVVNSGSTLTKQG